MLACVLAGIVLEAEDSGNKRLSGLCSGTLEKGRWGDDGESNAHGNLQGRVTEVYRIQNSFGSSIGLEMKGLGALQTAFLEEWKSGILYIEVLASLTSLCREVHLMISYTCSLLQVSPGSQSSRLRHLAFALISPQILKNLPLCRPLLREFRDLTLPVPQINTLHTINAARNHLMVISKTDCAH